MTREEIEAEADAMLEADGMWTEKQVRRFRELLAAHPARGDEGRIWRSIMEESAACLTPGHLMR